MNLERKKSFIYKLLIPGIFAISLAGTLWFNRQIIYDDIFYNGPTKGNLGICSPNGIPPTEWPATLTR